MDDTDNGRRLTTTGVDTDDDGRRQTTNKIKRCHFGSNIVQAELLLDLVPFSCSLVF